MSWGITTDSGDGVESPLDVAGPSVRLARPPTGQEGVPCYRRVDKHARTEPRDEELFLEDLTPIDSQVACQVACIGSTNDFSYQTRLA